MTDPPKAAPTETEASISKADSGSIVNVNGIMIAIVTGPPRPGSTPTQSPITVPRIMNENCFNCSAALKPRSIWSSIAAADLFQLERNVSMSQSPTTPWGRLTPAR